MQESAIVFMKGELIIMPLDTAPSGADLFGPLFLQRYCLSEAAWPLYYDLQVKITPYTVYLIPSTFLFLSKIIYFKPYPISSKIHITFIKFSFIFSIFKAEKEHYVLNTNLLRHQI